MNYCSRINTRYLNLTTGTRALINILLKKGWKLVVKFIQYSTNEDKEQNKPKYSIKKIVTGLIQLGLRTITKAGKKFFRNKLVELEVEKKDISKPVLKVGSLCTGMGSVPTALKSMGIDFDLKYSCEIDKHPKKTLAHNFSVEKQYEDIFNLKAKDLEYVDLLSAGFVCTSFSLSGKLEGINTKDGQMIFQIRDLIQGLIELNKAPKIIQLENVAHLARHDAKLGEFDSLYGDNFDKKIGHTLYIIEHSVFKPLEKFYDITWSIDNTLNYGIPHNRERWFCIMTLKQSVYDFDFKNLRNKRIPLTNCVQDHLEPEENIDQSYFCNKKFIKETYSNKKELQRVGSVEGVNYGQSKRVLGIEKSASCFICGENSKYLVNGKVRLLNVNEKLSLQGFPMWYKFPNKVGKTARHKMLGNTMSVNIVRAIFEVVFDKNNFKAPQVQSITQNPINNTNIQLKAS